MSKLVDVYKKLKKDNPDTIFLFKQGIFLIALSDDAKFLSEKFGFKLTNLNSDTLKCGFPNSNCEKYFSYFKAHDLNIKVVDSNIIYQTFEYSSNETTKKIVETIKEVDINSLSISEAYKFIEDLKKQVNIL